MVGTNPNTFFNATELDSYTIGTPFGGIVWGNNLRFSSPTGWKQIAYDSGHNQGSAFEYELNESWTFRFIFVADCHVTSKSGSNTLVFSRYLNDNLTDQKEFEIYDDYRQVVVGYTQRVSKGDVVHIRLLAKKLTDPIKIGGLEGKVNSFTAES